MTRRRPKTKPNVPRTRRRKAKDSPQKEGGLRIAAIGCVFIIGASVVIGRAYHLQIKNGAEYQGAAKRQSNTQRRVVAKRGTILDRNGDELALTVNVDTIFAEPRRIANPAHVAKKLSPILDIPVKQLASRLNSKRYFRYIKRRVSPKVAAQVQALNIKGIGIEQEPRRFYSSRNLASHILGFTNHEGKGVAGIERTYEEYLRGRTYEVSSLRDALGNKVLRNGFTPHAALEGRNVRLSIDRNIQHAAQSELRKAVVENGGKSGVALVLQPRTGDVLAMASYPDFNPNDLSTSNNNSHLNRAVSMVYEPGSTMKLVTISAALEDELVSSNETINCENGKWKVGRRTIRDGNHKYGELSLSDILKVSSNICSAKLGFKLGAKRLHHWLTEFGFGLKTDIGLPGELRGLMRPPQKWRDIALANISFGQGLAVTPLQVAQATAVIANDGVLVRPRIVKSIVSQEGEEEQPEITREPKRIMKAEVAQLLRTMMVGVTEEGGTAEAASIAGFHVAGKTGTSQKIDPVTRAYSRSLYVASFVGFVPADDPAAVILVLVDEPQKSIYGGVVAAPAFKNIAVATLSNLGIFPDDPNAKQEFRAQMAKVAPLPQAGDPTGEGEEVPSAPSLSESAKTLLGLKISDNKDLPGGWENAWEGLGVAEVINEHLKPGEARMPNLAGLSPREVLDRSSKVSCDLIVRGTGKVIKQSPAPGAIIRHGARCEVKLSPQG